MNRFFSTILESLLYFFVSPITPNHYKLGLVNFWASLSYSLLLILFHTLLILGVLFVGVIIMAMICKMLCHLSGIVAQGHSLSEVLDTIEAEIARKREHEERMARLAPKSD
jgi:hypothetical protein